MKKIAFPLAALVLFLILFAYIIQKAVCFPITHDEAGTINQYVDFKAYNLFHVMFWYHPLGNNHILNTLLTKLSIAIFGMKIWSLRLPNILAFGLYFYFTYKIISKNTFNFFVQTSALCLLCCHPFLLDFFALCRGYGLSAALFMGACYYLIEYVLHQKNKHQIAVMLFGCLAAYANFTMLNVLVVLFAILVAANINKNIKSNEKLYKGNIVISSILFFFFLWIIVPILNLKKAGEFEWGGANSFLNSTYYNILENDWYADSSFGQGALKMLGILIILVLSGSLLFQIVYYVRLKKIASKVHLLTLLILLMAIASSIIQHHTLGSAYLTNRTAIQFIPLLFLPVAFSLTLLEKLPKIIFIPLTISLCLVACFHVYATYNVSSPREWWYELHNKEVIAIIEKENMSKPNKVKLGCFWHFAPSINIYITRFGHKTIQEVPTYEELRTTADFDYYYIYYSDTLKLNKLYKQHVRFSNMVLMKKTD